MTTLSLHQSDTGKEKQESTMTDTIETVPVCIGHVTHAHEAALSWKEEQHSNTVTKTKRRTRLHYPDTEREASWKEPHPKASEILPALSGEWASCTLWSPKPRNFIRGGDLALGEQHQQHKSSSSSELQINYQWEERGVIFWHVPTVGPLTSDAAKLLWSMDDVNAPPICNDATTNQHDLRLLGRYNIWDYGSIADLPFNSALEEDDEKKMLQSDFEDDTVGHLEVLRGTDEPGGGGVACFFVPVTKYWEHVWPDLCRRRMAMELKKSWEEDDDNDDDDEESRGDLEDNAVPNGLHVLQHMDSTSHVDDHGHNHEEDDTQSTTLENNNKSNTPFGAVAVARNREYMFLRTFLHCNHNEQDKDQQNNTVAVKALIWYHSVGPDEDSFSSWRVGGNCQNEGSSSPVIPSPGIPPGGFLERNDQYDDLYGVRPFDWNLTRLFFDSVLNDNEDIVSWWNSLPFPLARRFVRRMIKGGFVDLWLMLEKAAAPSLFDRCRRRQRRPRLKTGTGNEVVNDDDEQYEFVIDRSCLAASLNNPEFQPLLRQSVGFEKAPLVSLETRRDMVGLILSWARRHEVITSWLELDFEQTPSEEGGAISSSSGSDTNVSLPLERIVGRIDDVEVNRQLLLAHPSPSLVLVSTRAYDVEWGDVPKEDVGTRPLMFAAEKGNEDLVKLFLELGAPPLQKSQSGWSALAFAAASGSASCIRAIANLIANSGDELSLTSSSELSSWTKEVFPLSSSSDLQGTLVDIALDRLALGLAFVELLQRPNLESQGRDSEVLYQNVLGKIRRGDLRSLALHKMNHITRKMMRQRSREGSDSREEEGAIAIMDTAVLEAIEDHTQKYLECAKALLELGVRPRLALEDDFIVDDCIGRPANEPIVLSTEEISRRVIQVLRQAESHVA